MFCSKVASNIETDSEVQQLVRQQDYNEMRNVI